jgi:spore maturation protein CgeB
VKRLLIVGRDPFDSVNDSYRRALAPFYEIRTFDPFSSFGGLERSLGEVWAGRVNQAAHYVMRAVVREPLALAEARVDRVAREFAPDLVLVSCIESLRPQTVTALRGGNPSCRVMGVFSDHLANFGRCYFMAADYDALFFKDRYVVEKLRAKLGWKHVHYLPQACDRQLHRPLPLDEGARRSFACDITLAGNCHIYRAEVLRPLEGRDLKIWGGAPARWMDHPMRRHFTGRYVAGDDKCKAMLAAKVVLNQNHYAEIAGTNKRTFEVAAIGAFQLTDTPALADVFDPATEVAAFDTQRDMLDKIDFYLREPELRRTMAARAQARAHAQHTYEHRWTAHLLALGLRPPAEFPVQPETLQIRPG